MKWMVVAFVVAARSAHADPMTSLSVDGKELAAALEALSKQREEPTGLVVSVKAPKLGLEKGDVIRAINGRSAADISPIPRDRDTSVVYFDVVRGGKNLVIRLDVKLTGWTEIMERSKLDEMIHALSLDPDLSLRQVTRNGKPSGVQVQFAWAWFPSLHDGDIVRKLDGVAVDTPAQLVAAMSGAAAQPQIVLELDRIGQATTMVIQLTKPQPKPDPDVAAAIQRLNDTTYEVSRAMLDEVLIQPAKILRIRIVPAIKDGKRSGYRLYAIRSSSAVAALGVVNGDTVVSIAGVELTSDEHALVVLDKIRTATMIKVVIERRGKPFTLELRVK